ncbi:MAG TPA: hypothetical protein VK524_33890 [Polyangiaceae bacterium]|nr:hypothetical protein [Polyangiaceae bacterium]
MSLNLFGLDPRAQALVFLGLWLPLSCASTSFDGQIYRSDELAFRVGPRPADWRPIDSDSALLAFRDDTHAATVAVNGRCGKDGDDVPLQALTHHLFLHFTDRRVLSQDVITLDGRDALRTEVVAELDGVPKRFSVYVIKKDGCVYDFVFIGDTQAADTGLGEFQRFVQGFATVSR